ncbi:MAG: RsmD family RNA methyltransferase [Phycisphaeraceae bacterium]|nr:RsmD family RNA methyltransferase [Phycisphaeraceae bacterium]
MRITAGTLKNRAIASPPHPDEGGPTRPITERVKEAVFSRLYSAGLLGGGNVLDVFAGTGSFGLEAISRGAEHCTFIERHRKVQSILEQNIEDLDLTDRATVLGIDALAGNWVHVLPQVPVRLIFLDPPYRLTADAKSIARFGPLLDQLAPVAEPNAGLMLRTHTKQAGPPPEVESWLGPKSIAYGTMTVHLYQRPVGPDESIPAAEEAPAASDDD